MRRAVQGGAFVVVVLVIAVAAAAGLGGGAAVAGGLRARVAGAYGRLPLSFEPNVGQAAGGVRFLARGAGSTLSLSSRGAVLALDGRGRSRGRALRLEFPGAGDPVLSGAGVLPGKVNYLVGSDRSRWRVGVSTYRRVRFRDLWPGIEASFDGTGSRIEYDLRLAAGADPRRIALRFGGVVGERIDAAGALVLSLAGGGQVRELAPVAYQWVAGHRRPVASRFVLDGPLARIALGGYDHRLALTIDPSLVYSTYLGGSGLDAAGAVAVNSAGEAYVTGFTGSTDFPLASPLQAQHEGEYDAFVSKLNAAGSALVYSTYLGGNGKSIGAGIALAAGDAYIAGSTTSTNFPTTAGAVQTKAGGEEDAFVAELNASGSALVYSTYLGGKGNDQARAIAVDAGGEAFVTGTTTSTNFPTANAQQSKNAGESDTFVTRLNTAGSGLLYSTYLGGAGEDAADAIAVDAASDAYVSGLTGSTNFPIKGGVQSQNGGEFDAFVTKLDPTGKLVYSTYLGGSANDDSNGIALDAAGDAYITGTTESTNFPTKNAWQPHNAGSFDAYVAELNAAGNALVYSTYLGGADEDVGYAIAVDAAGQAYVAGATDSVDFPTLSAEQSQPGGDGDAFVANLSPSGEVLSSTYLGGTGKDVAYGLALDAAGNQYVAGYTLSTNFPTVGAVQATCGGTICIGGDGFVTKLPFDTTPPTSEAAIPVCRGPVTFTVTDNPGGSGARAVDFRIDSGAEQTVATAGNPGSAQIGMPEGNDTLEYWGEDAAGNLESPHHLANVLIDTTPPSVSISDEQGSLAYEVGEPASVSVSASDAVSGLASDPSARDVPISTATPGHFTVTRTATDRCGNAATASFSYTVIPLPELAVSVDVKTVKGTVRVGKGTQFTALSEPRAIPVGSEIDASDGTVKLTTAKSASGGLQSGEFSDGEFKVMQNRSQKGLAELRMVDTGKRACTDIGKATAARKLSSKVLARLNAEARGRFSTHGDYSAATVRGTSWTEENRCDGTLTTVKRGEVSVRDFRSRRTITLFTGQSFLARAP